MSRSRNKSARRCCNGFVVKMENVAGNRLDPLAAFTFKFELKPPHGRQFHLLLNSTDRSTCHWHTQHDGDHRHGPPCIDFGVIQCIDRFSMVYRHASSEHIPCRGGLIAQGAAAFAVPVVFSISASMTSHSMSPSLLFGSATAQPIPDLALIPKTAANA